MSTTLHAYSINELFIISIAKAYAYKVMLMGSDWIIMVHMAT